MTSTGGLFDLERELNPAQLAAVRSGDGAHLVVAGAGSGKTRTLVYRVAHLVEGGQRPESILLLTFTRRAAQEMLRRATRLLDERCARVSGGTFHSFANQVLRQHAELLGYDRNFTILDRGDAADLVGIVRSELGYDKRERRFPRKDTVLDILSRHANTHRSLEEVMTENYPQFLAEIDAIEKIGVQYDERKHEQNSMDYDDLLVELRRLLVDHPSARRELSATYRHVLVDEYQDTNRLQAHIAALIASGHGNLMVVGDEAQSIYSFRGADFRNIIDFPEVFEDAKVTVLEQNYRSTQPILDFGNAVLEHAEEKYDKRLFTEHRGGQKPILLHAPDDHAEAEYACRKILELREEGVPLSEIAVLCRAGWHSNTLELELKSRNIPFRKFGGIKLVESAHVKDVTALMKLGLNPLDGTAWFRVLQLYPGIGPATARRLSAQIHDSGGALDPLTAPDLEKKKYAEDLAELRRLLEALADDTQPVGERFETAAEHYRPLLFERYDDAPRRQRDLETLLPIAERYRRLDEFLTDLAIEPPELGPRQAGNDPEDEWMTVSTIHSAKGLEWHTVILIHLNDSQFPNPNRALTAAEYEEERRLFYVAVTRAKRELHLIYPELTGRRGPYGNEIADLCPFLQEIGNLGELVETLNYRPEGEADVEALGEGEENAELVQRINDYYGA